MRKFLVMAVAATLSMGILGCGEEKKETPKTSGTVVKTSGDVKSGDAGTKPPEAPKGS
jgi:hypothetical protein